MIYIIQRDFWLLKAHKQYIMVPIMFLWLGVFLFIIALGPYSGDDIRISSAIIWVLALFSTMLGASHIIEQDYANGALEQVYLSAYTPWHIVMGKACSIIILYNVPIIAATIIPIIWLHISIHDALMLILTLLIGLPSLACLLTLGTLLTLGAKASSLLTLFIIMPFLLPLLIFASSAIVNHDYYFLIWLAILSCMTILIVAFLGKIALKELVLQ